MPSCIYVLKLEQQSLFVYVGSGLHIIVGESKVNKLGLSLHCALPHRLKVNYPLCNFKTIMQPNG